MSFQQTAIFPMILLVLLSVTPGCSTPSSTVTTNEIHREAESTGLNPSKTAQAELQPGLTVTYFLGYFQRDLWYLRHMKSGKFKTVQGKPILELNHQFAGGNVFDSGTNRGVALRMTGYLLFPDPGDYALQALSNDGILLYLSDKLILSDPKQHSDRLSSVAHVNINAGGAVPVMIEYFQRKGTAALKLFWKTPGSSEFVPVPQSAYAHTR